MASGTNRFLPPQPCSSAEDPVSKRFHEARSFLPDSKGSKLYQYYDVLCHVAGLRQDRARSTVLGVGWDPLLFLKDQAKGGVTLITSRGVKPISADLLIDRELGTQTSQPRLPLAGDKTAIRVRYLSQLERMSREELGRKEDLLPKAIAPPEMDPPLLPSQEHQLCPASTAA